MNRTLAMAPALALVALALGAGPAAAAELPLPFSTTFGQDLDGLLPVPVPTASPSPAAPSLPVPPPTAEPSTAAGPSKSSRTTRSSVVPKVRGEAGTRPVPAAAAPPVVATPLTGAASGLRFSSATVAAWSSYLGRPMAPTVAAAQAPLTATAPVAAAVPTSPTGGSPVAGTLALALLLVTGSGHVLVRRRLLPAR